MGSKIAARRVAVEAGVPVVPGETPTDQSDDAIADAARRVGFPVLLKPSEGGGGIGMKTARSDRDLIETIAQARREALAAFGDGTLYVERLIEKPRHIEFQILADHHGHVVHLFERECSIQRRHQKVIEESPSTAVTPALRQRMGEAAVAVARKAGYRNAGTVEFLLEGNGDSARFYFLEMNTRLQVEHPVTEQVTGVDLVRAQIGVARRKRSAMDAGAICRSAVMPSSCASTRKIRQDRTCRRPGRCCSIASRRCQAFESTVGVTEGSEVAFTTIRCSRS